MKTENYILPQRLSALLNERGVSQRELARGIGISTVTMSRIVNGKSVPPADVVLRIAGYLNVSTDALISGGERLHENARRANIIRNKYYNAFNSVYGDSPYKDEISVIIEALDFYIDSNSGDNPTKIYDAMSRTQKNAVHNLYLEGRPL